MRVIWGLIGLCCLAIGGSFLGAVHPVGDSLAVFRVGFCLGLLVLTLFLRGRGSAQICLFAIGLSGIATMLWHKLPLDAPGPITIYQKNMFHMNADIDGLAADILAAKTDFVTLQEVTIDNETLLDLLQKTYPHQHLCRYDDRSGVAVLSREQPVRQRSCGRGFGMAQILVDLPNGPHYIAAVHLSWPFPKAQPRQLTRLYTQMEALDHPILIGGDFNMVPWSHALSRLARASDTVAAGPARTTFLLGSLPIAIDHVFAPGGGSVETRPLLGGDHFGLLARVHADDTD